MPMKVNYGFQKAERERAKQAKKEAKQREKDAQAVSDSQAAEHVSNEASAPGDKPTGS